MSGVSLSSRAQPTWSEVTWSTRPASSRRQSASCWARGRSGGLILARPPSAAEVVLVHHEVVRAGLGASRRRRPRARGRRARSPRSTETWQRCVRQPVARPSSSARPIASVSATGGRASACAIGSLRPSAASCAERRRTMSSFSGWKQTSAPSARADRHRQQELAVGHAREAHGMGLERRDLEGRGTRRVQRLDLAEPAARRDRGVERDVDDRLGLDVRDLRLEARERVDRLGIVVGHVDDRRHAAGGGRGAWPAPRPRPARCRCARARRRGRAGRAARRGRRCARAPLSSPGAGEHGDAPLGDADLALRDRPARAARNGR